MKTKPTTDDLARELAELRRERARERRNTRLVTMAAAIVGVTLAVAVWSTSEAGTLSFAKMPGDEILASDFNDIATAVNDNDTRIAQGPKRQFIRSQDLGGAQNIVTKATGTLGFDPAFLDFTGDSLLTISPATQMPNTESTFTCAVARCVVDVSFGATADQMTTNQTLLIFVDGASVMFGNTLDSEPGESGLHVSSEFLMTQGQVMTLTAFQGINTGNPIRLSVSVVGYDQ